MVCVWDNIVNDDCLKIKVTPRRKYTFVDGCFVGVPMRVFCISGALGGSTR